MIDTNVKLSHLAQRIPIQKTKVMVIGLGSVGNYLLSYLLSTDDDGLEIIVAGRNAEKIQSDVNIAQVAALIRRQCKTQVRIAGGVDLEDISSISACLRQYQPDIIVNTSRVYAGLKYGSISWNNVRAYGIWTPLSIRYIRNIMEAYEAAHCEALVINTSYSDGTIPWLKSAGKAYPDFGSGNLNHLIPRMKMAAAEMMSVSDFWNVSVDLATAHFHDVVISKEGHAEGVEQLMQVSYEGNPVQLDQTEVLRLCSIPMPTDAKRNMMNASSNFDIIACILRALRSKRTEKFFSPGAFGEIGGYPVRIDGCANGASIDTSVFSLESMRQKNRESIALDGIENIKDGCLIYTDGLLAKVKEAFGVTLPKTVVFDEIDRVAHLIIEKIIEPALAR